VNYRLPPQVKVEKCIEDAAAAVAWAFQNIATYGGNKSLLFVSVVGMWKTKYEFKI
jgi:acetyl esterase/lipase